MSKNFGCVDMKDAAQQRILKATNGMTREQELAYWAERSKQMREEAERLRISQRKPA